MSNSYAKKFYLSPFGRIISFFLSSVGRLFTPFMIYGYYDQGSGRFRRLTRISSTAVLGDKAKIAIGDNCWIWHHSILDGSNGITIGKGVQIGAWVGIFTHSSHVAIRLHGDDYLKVDKSERIGYIRGSVIIGDYTFIGAGAKILPGVVIGKGCIISAGAIVSKHIRVMFVNWNYTGIVMLKMNYIL